MPDPPSDLPSFVVFHCCSEGFLVFQFFSFSVFQLISKVKSEASKEGGDSDYLQHFSFQKTDFLATQIFFCATQIFLSTPKIFLPFLMFCEISFGLLRRREEKILKSENVVKI